jgi:hypothetical protein
VFITLTVPSERKKYKLNPQARKRKREDKSYKLTYNDYIYNPKYDGHTTIKDNYRFLSDTIRDMYNDYKPKSNNYKHIKVVQWSFFEPMTDFTPHVHMIVYVPVEHYNEFIPYVKRTLKKYGYHGNGIDIEPLKNTAGATKYVSKYMSKGTKSYLVMGWVKSHSIRQFRSPDSEIIPDYALKRLGFIWKELLGLRQFAEKDGEKHYLESVIDVIEKYVSVKSYLNDRVSFNRKATIEEKYSLVVDRSKSKTYVLTDETKKEVIQKSRDIEEAILLDLKYESEELLPPAYFYWRNKFGWGLYDYRFFVEFEDEIYKAQSEIEINELYNKYQILERAENAKFPELIKEKLDYENQMIEAMLRYENYLSQYERLKYKIEEFALYDADKKFYKNYNEESHRFECKTTYHEDYFTLRKGGKIIFEKRDIIVILSPNGKYRKEPYEPIVRDEKGRRILLPDKLPPEDYDYYIPFGDNLELIDDIELPLI